MLDITNTSQEHKITWLHSQPRRVAVIRVYGFNWPLRRCNWTLECIGLFREHIPPPTATQNWSFFNKSSKMPRNNCFILPLCWSAKIIRSPTALNWDRENGTVLASETENRGFNFRLRQKFLFSKATRKALGYIQPSLHRIPKALSPEVKRLRREAKHSPQPGVEVNNSWCYTSTPPVFNQPHRLHFPHTTPNWR